MKALITTLAALSVAACAIAQDGDYDDTGPFTEQQAELMSAVWPEIREAAAFEQIDWRSVGLEYAPGDARAHGVMREHWDALRQAARFDDIDWEATTDYRAFAPGPATADRFDESGPFTDDEAQILSVVWPEIRVAARFEDIDWGSVGLAEAPGDAQARRFARDNWGRMRQAREFSDIDWEAVAG